MSKYAHRHFRFAISEKDILKPEAVGKNISDITNSDIQDWVSPFMWEKVRGSDILDKDGNVMTEKDCQKFLAKVHKWT